MKYCIVYIASGEIEAYFRDITKKLSDKFSIDDLSKRVPPHITLIYPFELSETEVDKVERNIEKVANAHKSSSFYVDGFDHFGYETIFLRIKANQECDRLIKDCIYELGDLHDEEQKFDQDSRINHISIVRHIQKDSFDAIWDYILSLPRPLLSGMFDNINILVKQDDVWKIYKSFYLGLT